MKTAKIIERKELEKIIIESLDSHIIGFAEDEGLSKKEINQQISSLAKMKKKFLLPKNEIEAINYLRETGSVAKYIVKKHIDSNLILFESNGNYIKLFDINYEDDKINYNLEKESVMNAKIWSLQND